MTGVDALLIQAVRCLDDNYAYVVRLGGDAWVVDPSDAAPIQQVLDRDRLTLRGVLCTHHHRDHIGGLDALLARSPAAWVAAATAAGHEVAGRPLIAIGVPGHTSSSVAWCLSEHGGTITDVFTGDTLFGAGCGRLFEGTPEEMWRSLRALTAFPAGTRLWFGHEYTAENLRFAATVEPHNADVRARIATLGPCTTPTTVALERATNPFVRAPSPQELARLRAARNRF